MLSTIYKRFHRNISDSACVMGQEWGRRRRDTLTQRSMLTHWCFACFHGESPWHVTRSTRSSNPACWNSAPVCIPLPPGNRSPQPHTHTSLHSSLQPLTVNGQHNYQRCHYFYWFCFLFIFMKSECANVLGFGRKGSNCRQKAWFQEPSLSLSPARHGYHTGTIRQTLNGHTELK